MASKKPAPIHLDAAGTRRSSRIAAPVQDPIPDLSSRLPSPTTDQWDWQLQAACRGMDSTWFFPPEREQSKARASRVARAKAVCARCPAMTECRDFALENGEIFGVWGGLSEDDRVKAWPVAATG